MLYFVIYEVFISYIFPMGIYDEGPGSFFFCAVLAVILSLLLVYLMVVSIFSVT